MEGVSGKLLHTEFVGFGTNAVGTLLCEKISPKLTITLNIIHNMEPLGHDAVEHVAEPNIFSHIYLLSK